MTTNKIVSLENFDNINENFVLRSPNKGKLYRGSNWNAFNRENLGSIPSSTENILFQEKGSDVKKGFMSQSERFNDQNRNESVKFSYPGPGNYQAKSTLSSFNNSFSTNPSHSSRGYGSGFVSTSERFDGAKEYYDKYYPGPGQYKNQRTSVSEVYNKSNIRYKSLYNTNKIKSLKVSKDNPGPGFYDPIIPLLLKKDQIFRPNHFFVSNENRFKEGSVEKALIPGPGRYFRNSDQTSLIKDGNKTSFFFKKEQETKIDPVEKHLNIPKVQKFHIPGPGEYNLRRDLIDPATLLQSRTPFIDERENESERKKEKELEHTNLISNIKKENFIPFKSPFENSKKGIKSVFESQSPKGTYVKPNHVPGPSYYNPQIIPDKINFNCNEEKKWI